MATAVGTMKVAQVPNPGADFQIVEREIPEMIETYPLKRADEAYARMMCGKAQFRVVLTM
jgi:D-arabinose 1-dehydrogenase-like Zn-dependent alcohol dehydrogenase